MHNLLRTHREEILRIASEHGACNVRVFGSMARDEADDQSDIDFLIQVGSKTSPWFPAGLILDLEQLLGKEGGCCHGGQRILAPASENCAGGCSAVKKDPRVYVVQILESAQMILNYTIDGKRRFHSCVRISEIFSHRWRNWRQI